MKATGHLRGLCRAPADRFRIRPVAIATDDHNAGMRGEPGGHRIGRAHAEDINDTASLQVDENRPVMVVPLLPGPVIDADDLEDTGAGGSMATPFSARRIVSSLMAMPNRASSRSPPRPPNACPTRCTTAPNRCVWWTRDAETPVNRSAKIVISHRALRHRQRLTRTRNVTARPCAATSFSVRQ